MLKKIRDFFVFDYSDVDDLDYRNEIRTNRTVALTLLGITFVGVLMVVLKLSNAFSYNRAYFAHFIATSALLAFLLFLYCFVKRGRGKYLKYVLSIGFYITIGIVISYLGSESFMLITLPSIVSAKYYSKRISSINLVLGILLVLFAYCFAPLLTDYYDLDVLHEDEIVELLITGKIDKVEYMKDALLYGFIPVLVMLTPFEAYSMIIAMSGSGFITKEQKTNQAIAKAMQELDFAKKIQMDMLPKESALAEVNNHAGVCSLIQPAKMVGGDFYDYFMIDDFHMCFLIADVSGKGFAAALFMAEAKAIIKSTILREDLEVAFKQINDSLCEGNEEGLFITCWLGILDLNSGELRYVNAGHTNSLMKHGNDVNVLDQDTNFVLGGLPGIEYKVNTVNLEKDDVILTFTDGVTEAFNESDEQYGDDRLQSFVKDYNGDFSELADEIKKSVEAFAGSREQADDITIVGVKVGELIKDISSKVFDAKVEHLPEGLAFVESEASKYTTDKDIINKLKVITDEIFVNVSSYAYKFRTGKIKIEVRRKDSSVLVKFTDNGVKFNPLEAPEPDTNKNLEDMEIGGLGIFMVENMADDVSYFYDGSNNLTVTMNI